MIWIFNQTFDSVTLFSKLKFALSRRNLFLLQLISLHSGKGVLHVTWYVTTPNKDIADFYANIRDAKNKVLVEHHLAYDTRKIEIKGDEISSEYQGQLQLCVLAKNSEGTIGSWFDSQCFDLPSDFENIKRQYSAGYHSVYTILSSKKNRLNASKSRTSKGCVTGAENVRLVFVGVLLSAIVATNR